MVADLAWSLLGVLIGGAITFWASRRYYMKASKDLENSTDELKLVITILADYMYRGGVLKEPPELDERGHLKWKTLVEQLRGIYSDESTGRLHESSQEDLGADPEGNTSRASQEPQEPTENRERADRLEASARPWWRRWFGGEG